MPETQRFIPPAPRGEDARGARSKLARHLILALGGTAENADGAAGDAADDPNFLDDVVASLVDDGVVSLARLAERRASELDLDAGLLGPAFVTALDRRRGHPAGARERARLGRLYALAGEAEKASSCFREVLDDRGSLPLGLVVELAEACARTGERGFALGAVDRVAELVLTGDVGKEGRVEDVAVAGAALERARDVALAVDAAPRAVALGRAAVLIYERSGLKRESARALDGLGRAQVAVGDRPAARATFERRRTLANNHGEPLAAARSLELAARAFLATGDAEAAVDRLEQAADGFSGAADRRAAANASFEAAELRMSRGDLSTASSSLERARAYSAASNDATLESRARLALARAHLGEGQLGAAMDEAEKATFDRDRANDRALAAEGRVLRAHALFAAGALDEAKAEVDAARDGAGAWAGGLALELRAELAALAGRADDAHALLADAARLFATAVAAQPERKTLLQVGALRAELRRIELLVAGGDLAGATARLPRVGSSEAPELVARIALVEAALATDDTARRAALDRAFDLAFATDYHAPRVAAGVARAKARVALAKPAPAAADVRAALESVRDARKSLPEERRAAYLATPLAKLAYETGVTVREALSNHRAERQKNAPADDETAGVETALNALDVLLGQLGAAPAPEAP